jgi:hypothetical protein
VIGAGPIAIMGVAFSAGLSDASAHKGLIVSGIAIVVGVVLYYLAVLVNPRLRGKVEEPAAEPLGSVT